MPETGILLTQAEERLLVEFMLSKGAVLVPDIDHSSTSYPEVRTIEQFLRFRAVTRLFFVLHEDFKVVPLEIMATQKEGRSVYYIMQRNGGPTIDFFSTVEFTEDGIEKVNPGYLAFHQTFWNPETGENQPPPAPLADFYTQLKKSFLKAHAKRVKLGKRMYWVGDEMNAALQRGAKSLGIKGVSVVPPRGDRGDRGQPPNSLKF